MNGTAHALAGAVVGGVIYYVCAEMGTGYFSTGWVSTQENEGLYQARLALAERGSFWLHLGR